MIRFLENIIVAIWNRLVERRREARFHGGTHLGLLVADERVTKRSFSITNQRRSTHMALLGKTGSGKSFFLRHLAEQDIQADRGFLYFDLHGDATPFLLATINLRERREHRHLTDKLIVIDPADPMVSVGFNPLESQGSDFVRVAELVQILKKRWHLDSFGARTDELLRNSLYALSVNHLTLVELTPFLTDANFRMACMTRVENPDIRQYFELRFENQSEAMQAVMREPILNKTSAFTADPHFRHIVGQPSTVSMKEAMDEGYWVLVNLAKGKLGEQTLTLGSLMLTVLKNALFTREKRSLFTVYCDEIQNLVSYGSDVETMLSESRKFQVGMVTCNQFLAQHSQEMREAILSVGTHVFFQLSSTDAAQIAQALDGGRSLAEHLKNLRQRHAIVKTGSDSWQEIAVPTIRVPEVDYTDTLNRSRLTRGRARVVIERAIAKRQADVLHTREEKPQSDGNRKVGMVLQERDRRLLQELTVMRVVDRDQAKIVAGFNSVTRVNARLLTLTRAGLLRRFFVGTSGAKQRALYTLSTPGAQLVGSSHRGLQRRKDDVSVGSAFVEHQLAVNNLYCTLKFQPVPLPDIAFPRWLAFDIPIAPRLVPDGYLEFRAPAKILAALLEVDLGTERLGVWTQKVRSYLQFSRSGAFEHDFGSKGFRVLVIANSDRRMHSIRKAASELTDSMFWFSTAARVENGGFFQSSWLRPNDDTFRPLFGELP